MPSTGFNFSCLTVLLNTSPRRKIFCSFMCVQNIASGTALLWDCDFAWTYNWLQFNVHDSGTASFLSWSTCRSWNVNILHTLSSEISHAPDHVSVQPLQPCHELWGLTWRRIRNTRSRHVRRFREGNWFHGKENQNHQSIILHIKNALFL